MAHDYEKDRRLEFRLPHNSPILALILKDVENSGQSLAAVLAIRITDYYTGVRLATPPVAASAEGRAEKDHPGNSQVKQAKANALAFLDSDL